MLDYSPAPALTQPSPAPATMSVLSLAFDLSGVLMGWFGVFDGEGLGSSETVASESMEFHTFLSTDVFNPPVILTKSLKPNPDSKASSSASVAFIAGFAVEDTNAEMSFHMFWNALSKD